MTALELLTILRLVAQEAPDIINLIQRLKNGEQIEVTDAQLEAGRQAVHSAVMQRDNTPPGQRN